MSSVALYFSCIGGDDKSAFNECMNGEPSISKKKVFCKKTSYATYTSKVFVPFEI